MDGYLGEIRAFGFNFVPQGWALCDGSKMAISQNPGLYSILGANYGPSDGRTYFSLPDLRGMAPICIGNTGGAAGIPSVIQSGQELGDATVSLNIMEVPNHTHQVNGAVAPSATTMVATPASNSLLSHPMSGSTAYLSLQNQNSPNTLMSNATIQFTGTSAAHNNMQPYLALNFCICLDGEYPVPAE